MRFHESVFMKIRFENEAVAYLCHKVKVGIEVPSVNLFLNLRRRGVWVNQIEN